MTKAPKKSPRPYKPPREALTGDFVVARPAVPPKRLTTRQIRDAVRRANREWQQQQSKKA